MDILCPTPSNDARTAAAALTGHSAVEPKLRTSLRRSFSRRPSGKNGNRQRKISRLSAGFICVFAALSRWRAHLVC